MTECDKETKFEEMNKQGIPNRVVNFIKERRYLYEISTSITRFYE